MTDKPQSNFPIIGKWYKVINGQMAGFIGKCVNYDMEEKRYPMIIQDLNYMTIAVSIEEVEPTIQQPDQFDIDRISKN